MLLILLTLFASLSFANGGTFNVEQDGEDNNIDYDIESMDEFVINLDQTGNDNNINIDVDGRTSVGSSMTINQTGNNKSYTGNLYCGHSSCSLTVNQ
jgi:hypothetical protein